MPAFRNYPRDSSYYPLSAKPDLENRKFHSANRPVVNHDHDYEEPTRHPQDDHPLQRRGLGTSELLALGFVVGHIRGGTHQQEEEDPEAGAGEKSRSFTSTESCFDDVSKMTGNICCTFAFMTIYSRDWVIDL